MEPLSAEDQALLNSLMASQFTTVAQKAKKAPAKKSAPKPSDAEAEAAKQRSAMMLKGSNLLIRLGLLELAGQFDRTKSVIVAEYIRNELATTNLQISAAGDINSSDDILMIAAKFAPRDEVVPAYTITEYINTATGGNFTISCKCEGGYAALDIINTRATEYTRRTGQPYRLRTMSSIMIQDAPMFIEVSGNCVSNGKTTGGTAFINEANTQGRFIKSLVIPESENIRLTNQHLRAKYQSNKPAIGDDPEFKTLCQILHHYYQVMPSSHVPSVIKTAVRGIAETLPEIAGFDFGRIENRPSTINITLR